jgi:pimeloyl-ACP methyl ester carboxylesterase
MNITQLSHGTVAWRELGQGTPLLILHGWGVDSSVMVPLMQRLSPLRRCIAIDFPGFGASPAPSRAWDVDDYATLVRDFMTANGIDQCDILAHSFGGRVALSLLAADSDRSTFGKVLITGGAGMKPRRSWRYYYRRTLSTILKAPFSLLPTTTREKGLARLRTTSIWKSLGSADYQQLQGVMREIFVKTVNYYQEPLLPRIPHDVLLLWGADDQATPLYQGQRLEQGLKNAALVKIERAGHYAFLDQSAQFGAIAEAFFKG